MTIEEFNSAVDVLTEAWRQFAASLNEIIDSMVEAFGQLKEDREKTKPMSSPRKYGMSLVKRKEWISHYHYIPVVRRNLPYQRRRF